MKQIDPYTLQSDILHDHQTGASLVITLPEPISPELRAHLAICREKGRQAAQNFLRTFSGE